jgi:predicted chitinase
MIGFIAGILAGLAIAGGNLSTFHPDDVKTLLGIAAAGYAGADFIENSLSLVIHAPAAGGAASGSTGGGTATVGATGDSATAAAAINAEHASAVRANAAGLASAVDKLTSTSAQIASNISTLAALGTPSSSAAPETAAPSIPKFAPALHSVAPKLDLAKWEPALSNAFQRYGVTNNKRVAAAVGQFLVEAGGGFEEVVEKMGYTAPRMMEVWPSKFKTEADAAPYVHQPEKLGNFIYANKLGNGDEASGDGYRFRGRGLIQLTGRTEYAEFAAAIGVSADDASAYCETPEGAAESGCWYLATRGCLPFADAWNLAKVTLLVNGRKMQDHARRVSFSNAMLSALNRA